jgi:hypothetical protein
MQSFDNDYLARREKQIEDLYMLRAMTAACVITGAVLAGIALILMSADHNTLGAILFVIALLFEMGSLFMVASYLAERAADRAIREEYERLALYGEKAKRGSVRFDEIPLDDGEISAENASLEDMVEASSQQQRA